MKSVFDQKTGTLSSRFDGKKSLSEIIRQCSRRGASMVPSAQQVFLKNFQNQQKTPRNCPQHSNTQTPRNLLEYMRRDYKS